MVISEYELKIIDVCDVLFFDINYCYVVEVGVIGNMLVVVFLNKDLFLVGEFMEKDLYYEFYCMRFVSEFFFVWKEVKVFGVYGVLLSGVGLSVLCLVLKGKGKVIVKYMYVLLLNCEIDVL